MWFPRAPCAPPLTLVGCCPVSPRVNGEKKSRERTEPYTSVLCAVCCTMCDVRRTMYDVRFVLCGVRVLYYAYVDSGVTLRLPQVPSLLR